MVPGIEPLSEQSPFPRRVPGSNKKNMDNSIMKRVLRDSKPISDTYVASAQTGDGTLNPVANKASAQTGAQSIAYRDSAQTTLETEHTIVCV
ncbi:hypothetical protein DPMN_120269 [Dreissena polymorpha]|uniref:Uncharacterized protein n=1 Tax=Dreissena polymorpha TaxID=45954 RepID=A0A9D4GMZ5_DREPO|nr:hypothetical protein DPMN_120269 [Dreissena polymorpha]